MPAILITCPNATCSIPEAQRELFKGSEDLVTSPEGWEPGALNLAQGLAMRFSTPLIHGEVSRLVIDLEQEGERLWGAISATLPESTRGKIIERQKDKFRSVITARLNEDLKRHNSVLHLDVHTAPIGDGVILLEHTASALAQSVSDATARLLPTAEIHVTSAPMNAMTPFTRWLLDSFQSGKYGIIRITVSQSFFMRSVPMRWETIKKSLINSLVTAVK